jgi:putative FmdB family regulatory protein
MPIYEYRCENGHEFEVFQSMSEDPVSKCMECGAKAQRVLSAPAVHFKGSGFYTTDYARNSKAGSDSSSSTETKSSESASSDSKSSPPEKTSSSGSAD